MNRTPIVLSLLGLVLFLFGVYMMLRVVMAPISGGTMSDDPASQAHLDELRQDGGPESWVRTSSWPRRVLLFSRQDWRCYLVETGLVKSVKCCRAFAQRVNRG